MHLATLLNAPAVMLPHCDYLTIACICAGNGLGCRTCALCCEALAAALQSTAGLAKPIGRPGDDDPTGDELGMEGGLTGVPSNIILAMPI